MRIATAPRIQLRVKGGFDSDVDVDGRAHVNVKGNNGRHVGQDGTWARDSGGSRSTGDSRDRDSSGGKAKVDSHSDDHGVHDAKTPSNDKSPGAAKSSGGSVKSSGGGAKASGGGSAKGGKH